MSIEHHTLHKEFPEYNERITQLKTTDNHFAKLFDEYHDVDRQVYRVEAQQEAMSDTALEDAKKKRALLKDQLYNMLRAGD